MGDSSEFALAKHNALHQTDSGVWVTGSISDFNYTDGESQEKYLKDVISSADDVSSQSVELDDKIIDWVSEYHLSSQRANLLRAFSVNGIQNALELGCGCGAITRYLGEYDIATDAIEGNRLRAEIARLRCRDQKHVNIINANFNDLSIPENEYDAVLLIGALEYAKKYFSKTESGNDAVKHILSVAMSSVKKNGVVFAAIENRMGLKYWMGATEDHYGQPHVGLYGYSHDHDIRTYNKKEWEKIVAAAGVQYYRFIYPFPDYKLPRVIASDSYIQNDRFASNILDRIPSRDYLKPWHPYGNEYLIWKSLHQSGYLEDFSNSFIILISDSQERLDEIVPYDFVHFSYYTRKPQFRVTTKKPEDMDSVIKEPSVKKHENGAGNFVQQHMEGSPYIRGQLLSSIWLDAIAGCKNPSLFLKLINEYYYFIKEHIDKNEKNAYAFDFLPFNIIVDDENTYRLIDNEWTINQEITPDYILFRALLYFASSNRMSLSTFCAGQQINTIEAFIRYGFEVLSVNIDQFDQFVETEEKVQKEINITKKQNLISDMLREPFQSIADSGVESESRKALIGRLEDEQHSLKSKIQGLENEREGRKKIIFDLERDQKVLNEHIVNLENFQHILKRYVHDLENVQQEHKQYINDLEIELKRLRQYATDLENDKLERDRYLKDLEEDHIVYKQHIINLETENTNFKKMIVEGAQNRSELAKQIDDNKNMIMEMKEQTETIINDLGVKNLEIKEKNDIISRQKHDIKNKEWMIQEKEYLVALKTELIEKQKEQIEDFQTKMNKQTMDLQSNDVMIKDKERHIERLANEIDTSREHIENMEAIVSDQKAHILNLEAELERVKSDFIQQSIGYESSLSWKVTKPLRKVSGCFKKDIRK